jgi:SAM-dependent methyltransferase
MVFSLDWLARIRAWEIDRLAPLLPRGGAVLDVGAGTGQQSRLLAERGFRVTAIDLAASSYAAHREYPVQDYDGQRFPLADASVDCVFSSNVLEHVHDLPMLHREVARVLKPGGYAVHVMPTAAWRFWTTLSGFADIPAAWIGSLRSGCSLYDLARSAAGRVLPFAHGARGNAITELWAFRMASWRAHFMQSGWRLRRAEPLGLFYTGWNVLGPRLPIAQRQRLARLLGSAVAVYVVEPPARPGA